MGSPDGDSVAAPSVGDEDVGDSIDDEYGIITDTGLLTDVGLKTEVSKVVDAASREPMSR